MCFNNFPWAINKHTNERETLFIITERYGDASFITINPKESSSTYSVYNSTDGIVIKFSIPEEKMSDFIILIKN